MAAPNLGKFCHIWRPTRCDMENNKGNGSEEKRPWAREAA